MRQVAWFTTVPKPLNPKVSAPQISRGQRIRDNGGHLLYPEVPEEVEYVLAHWYDLGCVSQGGMGGVGPLAPSEINAWQQGCGLRLNPYEFRLLLALSRAYAAELQAAEKPDCPPPYGNPVNTFDRAVVSKKMADALKSLQRGRKHEHRKTHN